MFLQIYLVYLHGSLKNERLSVKFFSRCVDIPPLPRMLFKIVKHRNAHASLQTSTEQALDIRRESWDTNYRSTWRVMCDDNINVFSPLNRYDIFNILLTLEKASCVKVKYDY